jgi:hypothetical protein
MVVDALLAAEPALRLAERAHDPAAFCRMDDGVLDFIENVDLLSPAVSVDAGAEAALAEAQAIVSRLRRRQLYRYVTDAPVPAEPRERGRWAAPSAEDVVACYGGAAVRLDPADVIVQEIKIGELCCAGIIFADCQQFADLPAPPPHLPLRSRRPLDARRQPARPRPLLRRPRLAREAQAAAGSDLGDGSGRVRGHARARLLPPRRPHALRRGA